MSSLNPSADQTATKKDETPSAPAVEPTKTPAAALEEDDEFEDFPVEDWPIEETADNAAGSNAHLWEESWDDDDTNEDFAKELRAELEKAKASK